MLRYFTYTIVIMMMFSADLFGADRDAQLIQQIAQRRNAMERETHAWRHTTASRLCCYYAGMTCSCCVPCCIGTALGIRSEEEYDAGGQPVCGLQQLEPLKVAAGIWSGAIAAFGFDWWYSPDQRTQQQEISELQRQLCNLHNKQQ
jgi:hypothetical protein